MVDILFFVPLLEPGGTAVRVGWPYRNASAVSPLGRICGSAEAGQPPSSLNLVRFCYRALACLAGAVSREPLVYLTGSVNFCATCMAGACDVLFSKRGVCLFLLLLITFCVDFAGFLLLSSKLLLFACTIVRL